MDGLARRGLSAETIKYAKDRKAFGKPIAEFQNTKFKLAEIAAKTHASMAKYRHQRHREGIDLPGAIALSPAGDARPP